MVKTYSIRIPLFLFTHSIWVIMGGKIMEEIKTMFALEGATDSGLKFAIESMSDRKQILIQLL